MIKSNNSIFLSFAQLYSESNESQTGAVTNDDDAIVADDGRPAATAVILYQHDDAKLIVDGTEPIQFSARRQCTQSLHDQSCCDGWRLAEQRFLHIPSLSSIQ